MQFSQGVFGVREEGFGASAIGLIANQDLQAPTATHAQLQAEFGV
jgi:hypothetical protein